MPDATETWRLAVGVFYEPDCLKSAIADLRSAGFGEGEICLAGRRQVLEGALQGMAELAARQPLPAGNLQMLGEGDHGEIVTSSRELLETLLSQAKSRPETSTGPSSFLPELCERMAEHMQQGGIVLLVTAQDSAQQNRSSRVLLRHSRHSVQTYEFTPPR